MQHDVFANPAPRTRSAYPSVVVLQADVLVTRKARIVAPMAVASGMRGATGKLLPSVRHAGAEYRVALELVTSLPLTALRDPLGSIAAYRDDIVRALDWSFTGV